VIGEPRVHVAECESTQLLLDASMAEGTIATTDHQTSGRGRLGRRWDDEPGTSLLCSVLLKPPADRRAAEVTLVAGLATAETVERALGLSAQIKWPNDVMVDRRKVAGGTAELRGGAVILGVGVNVNQTRDQLPADTRTPAATLRTIDGRAHEREPILADLLVALDRAYEAWLAGGLDALYGEIGARDFLRGRRVSVIGTSGTALMIARDGRLEIETAAGNVAVDGGELTYER
jgi:BirA family biotin operon repressor/biotin-[acetyl-CoA-carboxylase] ligase